MNKAPWLDYAGNEIYEGDTIRHPDGTTGKVIFSEFHGRNGEHWFVDYNNPPLSLLSMQIGNKGQAVVVPNADITALP